MGFTSSIIGVEWNALYTTDYTTAPSTAATAALTFGASKKSGTSIGAMGANALIAVFRDNTNARFCFRQDGTSYEDVGTAWVNYDEEDDVKLLENLSVAVSRKDDPIHKEFRDFAEENRDRLEQLDLVVFNEDGHHFVNTSKLAMLNIGAIRQLARKAEIYETALALLGIDVNSPEFLEKVKERRLLQ